MTTEGLRPLAGKKVLVTGADGFIGSHVVERMIAGGADVTAFCLYNSFGQLGWLDQSEVFAKAVRSGQARSLLGDVRDAEFVSSAVAGNDIVLHLAALIAIPYSYAAPRSYVDTNVTGTLNVLEAARRSGVERMIQTSTSEVYGTPETVPITETHPLRGQSPYSATKIAADKLAEAYASSFEMPVVTLRPFNTYGPRQSARAIIPTILGQLLAGAQQIQLGSLAPKRDFTFVTDTAEGFAMAATADLAPGETIQLGTGRTVSVGALADICMEVTGRSARITEDPQRVRPAGSEVEVLLSSPAKASRIMGWEPTVDLEAGIRQTADWMRDAVDLRKAGEYRT